MVTTPFDQDMTGWLGQEGGWSRPGDPHASLALVEEIEAARQYCQRARAANTTRAYASDWAKFEGWCWGRNLDPLPASPQLLATYLAARARAGNASSTITRHLAAIGWQHRQAGAVAPQTRDSKMVIADTLAGIRRV